MGQRIPEKNDPFIDTSKKSSLLCDALGSLPRDSLVEKYMSRQSCNITVLPINNTTLGRSNK